MDLIETLKVCGGMGSSSVGLFHAPSLPPEAIAATVRAHIGRHTTVARLRSDAICAGEGAFLRDALVRGDALVLIGDERQTLPSALLNAWHAFQESPRHTYSDAGRFIHFEPGDGGGRTDDRRRASGILVLVLPKTYAHLIDPGLRDWIESIDDLGAPAPPVDDIRDLGRAAVAVSMKMLYFLHHRDTPGAEHHGSVSAMMKGDRPLTWRDLRRALQQQPDDHMLDILESLHGRGQLSAEQLDLAAAAIPFLGDQWREDERVGGSALAPSIYHLIWTYEHLFRQRKQVYRGQRDSRWRQDTTLLRADVDGRPASLETIVLRLHRTQAFLDALAACERDLVGRDLDDDERLAIAQHYGFPTALLDYTRSLEVAAFFATGSGDASVLRDGDVGVIYYVSPTESADAGTEPASNSFDFAGAAGIRVGRMRTIEPGLPDAENRVARQLGVFVEGFDSRDLQRMSAGVLYFRQATGEAFEDARAGITRARLLPPDATLERLASTVAGERPRLSPRLTSTRIPGDDLFGALGVMLQPNLRRAQEFLNEAASVAERMSPVLWPAIAAILSRHFNEARVKARTSDVSVAGALTVGSGRAGIRYVLDEVDQAFAELSALADLPDDELKRQLGRHRPALGPDMRRTSVNEPIAVRSPSPTARLVTAVATFIVALEYLRTVRGEMALQYIQRAAFTLDERVPPAG